MILIIIRTTMNKKLIIMYNAAKLTHHSSIVSIIHPIFSMIVTTR